MKLVVEGTGQPILASDFDSPGGILSVVPEGYEHDLNALAKATLILIKFRPEDLKSGTIRNWTYDGIVAYSKICTHVGCPAALYEQTTHHILCPCHQSTFDATDGARVIFGPAARPLPQLPIGVDGQGYLIAQADFDVPVGPSFWERGDAEADAREARGTSRERDSKPIAGTATYLDDRLGAGSFLKRNLRKVFPDHWSFLLGEIALYSFIILLLTGTFLTFWFKPSMRARHLRRLLPAARGRRGCRRPTPRRCTSASRSGVVC